MYIIALPQGKEFQNLSLDFCFLIYNRNGDGFIDREEFTDILRSTGEPITEEEIEELMTDGDTNKDGKIDFDGKMNTIHSIPAILISFLLLIKLY